MKAHWALGAAFGALLAGPSLGATTISIYDGLTYGQLKSILGATHLGLTEKVTDKGNKYLIVTSPGLTASFIATSMNCEKGQAAPCDGFTFFYVDRTNTMSSSQMGTFNREHHFSKIAPATDNHPLLNGEYYARGGITETMVRSAGAYYTVEISEYLQTAGSIAANGQLPPLAYADAADPDRFFAGLAQRGTAAPAPKPLTAAEEAHVDELVAGHGQ